MINNYQKIKKDIDRLYLTNKFFCKSKKEKNLINLTIGIQL